MRKTIKGVAAFLAVLFLTGCSLVQLNTDRVVVAQVKDHKITLTAYLQQAIPIFNQYQVNPLDTSQQEYIDSLTDAIIDTLVMEQVQKYKMEELNIKEEPSDYDAAAEQAEEILAEQWQIRHDAYMIEYPDATEEEAKADADAYNASMFSETYTLENFIQDTLTQNIAQRLIDTTTDVTVTDEQVRAEFDTRMSEAKAGVENDLGYWETNMTNEHIYYTPEGLYYIKHILIKIPDDKAQEISALRSEDKAADADALLEAELAKIQDKADEILAKVQAGDDFDTLIELHGEDPGMASAQYAKGYVMYEGKDDFMQPFTDAALTLTEDGNISGLVATDYGYHILKRISTIEPGELSLDEVKDELYEEMLTTQKNEAFQVLMEQWKSDMNIQIWKNRIRYN